jgi:uncharacterized damage-inducible protein DinB
MRSREFIQENEAARRDMAQIIARLDEPSFALPTSPGWTVSSTLCHLAFWDQRAAHLLARWQQGPFEVSSLSPLTVDSINQAVQALSKAVPGPAAAKLALDSAAAADSAVSGSSDELIGQILDASLPWVCQRSLHRREHLKQIRQALEGRS